MKTIVFTFLDFLGAILTYYIVNYFVTQPGVITGTDQASVLVKALLPLGCAALIILVPLLIIVKTWWDSTHKMSH